MSLADSYLAKQGGGYPPMENQNTLADHYLSGGDYIGSNVAGSNVERQESGGREFRGVDETIDRVSTAFSEPSTKGVPTSMKPITSVGEGVVDFTLGAGAGVNDLFAGLINLFDDENAADVQGYHQDEMTI